MDVYFIRHGQSEANLNHFYCGWSQVSLTEKGFEDARNAGELLRGVSFSKVYASDLLRTRQTCETALPGCSYEADPLLRELGIGNLVGLTVPQAQEMYGEVHAKAAALNDFTPFGGENRQMELDRTQEFLRKLENAPEEGSIAVFCHLGTICCVLQLMLGFGYDYHKTPVENGAICVFRVEKGMWRLRKWNLTGAI